MKYIVCEKPGEFLLKEKEAPIRKTGEALLKITKIGICGTDLHAYAGNQAFFNYPRILGHEIAARVAEIDENDKGLKVGDNVVVIPHLYCGSCVACRQGKTNCCTSLKLYGVHTDGAMQEYFAVPVALLLPAQKLTDGQIALVEPLAIGAHAVKRAQLVAGETIVVLGCGPIGLGLMKFAKLAGTKVIAVDLNKDRLAYAKQVMGVDHTVMAGENATGEIDKLTNGDMATAVFDCTGHKGAMEAGPDYMAHGGRFILVGLYKGSLCFDHPKIHAKETTIICSRNAVLEDFKYVLKVMEDGDFPADSFITHTVDFTEMIANFERWLDPATGVIKATVNF
ncbi:MAG: zinc-binding alcohol dehydrogenase family protein [Flavobacteriaceae bacterium]